MNRDYSRLLRVWHWLNAIVITGLLGTFLLRKTFLSWRANSDIIMDKFLYFDIDITTEQAKVVAKAIRAPMWEWHIIFGIALAVLMVFRIIILIKEGGFNYDSPSFHLKMVHIGYKVFYLILLFMAISGLVLVWYKSMGISKDIAHSIKEIHEFVAWAVVIFVPLHIVGVVIADSSDQKGIVSKMISG